MLAGADSRLIADGPFSFIRGEGAEHQRDVLCGRPVLLGVWNCFNNNNLRASYDVLYTFILGQEKHPCAASS